MTIRKSIWVERGREIAFHVFCTEIGAWWPGGFGGDDIIMTLETRVGGRLFEKRADGTEYVIGLVTTYEPPKAVAFTWRAPSWELTTQVEVRFIADGTGTRIELSTAVSIRMRNCAMRARAMTADGNLCSGVISLKLMRLHKLPRQSKKF